MFQDHLKPKKEDISIRKRAYVETAFDKKNTWKRSRIMG
jgi:hypothetical protein